MLGCHPSHPIHPKTMSWLWSGTIQYHNTTYNKQHYLCFIYITITWPKKMDSASVIIFAFSKIVLHNGHRVASKCSQKSLIFTCQTWPAVKSLNDTSSASKVPIHGHCCYTWRVAWSFAAFRQWVVWAGGCVSQSCEPWHALSPVCSMVSAPTHKLDLLHYPRRMMSVT